MQTNRNTLGNTRADELKIWTIYLLYVVKERTCQIEKSTFTKLKWEPSVFAHPGLFHFLKFNFIEMIQAQRLKIKQF